ncbi:hypothetical protein KAZ57_00870, partial [Patescibacteria group bacterium]|nr:hypothetical protein [Patescibacteria group bacterium]
MKSKKAKNILLFVFSSLVLGLYVYKNITIQNTLSTSFVFPAPKLASQNQKCDLLETLEYVDYKQSDWEVNNKFGIYIYAENKDFFELAQTLVNSNGGDWGYALVPFNVNDRDFGKWNRAFEQMRNKHLIPIIQLWAIDPDDYYDQTKDAAIFLNQFIWPIKPRYISAYNEMNDAKFWGGEVNPEQYAEVLDATIQLFKAVNDNFFIMNGAFNVSAPTDSSLGTLDSFTYMRRMDAKVPGIFSGLDGWASHPYPQPNFSGNPD